MRSEKLPGTLGNHYTTAMAETACAKCGAEATLRIHDVTFC